MIDYVRVPDRPANCGTAPLKLRQRAPLDQGQYSCESGAKSARLVAHIDHQIKQLPVTGRCHAMSMQCLCNVYAMSKFSDRTFLA